MQPKTVLYTNSPRGRGSATDRSKPTSVPERRCEVEAGTNVVHQEALGLAHTGTKHILLRVSVRATQ